jgi:hypothetical protein
MSLSHSSTCRRYIELVGDAVASGVVDSSAAVPSAIASAALASSVGATVGSSVASGVALGIGDGVIVGRVVGEISGWRWHAAKSNQRKQTAQVQHLHPILHACSD